MGVNAFLVTGIQPQVFTFGAARAQTSVAVEASNAVFKNGLYATFQGILTGGTSGATIQIQVTNEQATAEGTNSNWINLGSAISLTTGARSAGFADVSAWKYVRANITANDGTVSILMGA